VHRARNNYECLCRCWYAGLQWIAIIRFVEFSPTSDRPWNTVYAGALQVDFVPSYSVATSCERMTNERTRSATLGARVSVMECRWFDQCCRTTAATTRFPINWPSCSQSFADSRTTCTAVLSFVSIRMTANKKKHLIWLVVLVFLCLLPFDYNTKTPSVCSCEQKFPFVSS